MQPDEFRGLIRGRTDAEWCAYFGVGAATFRRWKTGQARIPEAVAHLLRFHDCYDLSAIFPGWDGFNINQYGLFVPGFKYRFPPGEIKGFFFRNQTVGMLESEIRNLKHRIEELEGDLARETERAEKYRGIARTESRFGLIWERVVS